MTQWTPRSIFLLFFLNALAPFVATAEVTVTPRTDHVLSIQGSFSEKIKISFGEVFYLAANLLDPSCLLRYPNGQFGFVSESVVIDPIIQSNNSFKIEMPMNHYNGNDTCQFQFAFIKFWLKDSKTSADESGGYVLFAKTGTVLGGSPAGSASAIDRIACKKAPLGLPENQDLHCAFFNAQGKSIQVGVPTTGLNIEGLRASF